MLSKPPRFAAAVRGRESPKRRGAAESRCWAGRPFVERRCADAQVNRSRSFSRTCSAMCRKSSSAPRGERHERIAELAFEARHHGQRHVELAPVDDSLLDEVLAEQLAGEIARHERRHSVLRVHLLADAALLAEPEARAARDQSPDQRRDEAASSKSMLRSAAAADSTRVVVGVMRDAGTCRYRSLIDDSGWKLPPRC